MSYQKGFRELGGLFLDDVDVVDAVLPELLKSVPSFTYSNASKRVGVFLPNSSLY